eukprot:gene19449-22983_t
MLFSGGFGDKLRPSSFAWVNNISPGPNSSNREEDVANDALYEKPQCVNEELLTGATLAAVANLKSQVYDQLDRYGEEKGVSSQLAPATGYSVHMLLCCPSTAVAFAGFIATVDEWNVHGFVHSV